MPRPTPIEMLKRDHRKVEETFQKFLSADPDDHRKRRSAVDKACRDLWVHMRLEEEVFYPEVEKAAENGRLLIAESLREHNRIKDAISTVKSLDENDPNYEAAFLELRESTAHHIKDEEVKIFPFVEQNLKDEMGAAMTAKMVASKGKHRLTSFMES